MAINGNDVGLYVEDVITGSGASTLVGALTGCSFSSTNQEIDVTSKDNSGARSVLPGGNQAEITFEGFFDPAATFGFQDLINIHANRTRVWVKMEYTELVDLAPARDAAAVTGYAYLNTLEWTGPLNAGSTFSGTFTIDDGWSYSIT